jgi:alpha-1,6-mannosyltransferase
MVVGMRALGVAGTVLCVGLLALVWAAQNRSTPTLAIVLYLFISLVYLILVTHFSGWERLVSLRFVLGFALLFRLEASWMASVFTDDLYRYRWEGRLQLAGGNPYQERPGDPRWSALRDETFPLVDGKDFKAVYGPLVENLQREMARLSDSVWIYKAPAILADLALLLLLARWHGARAALLYGWCPLAIVEFAGMGHNDALLILALTLAMRYRSGVALGLAIAVKWWPALLLPAFIRADRRTAWAVLVPAVLFLPYLSDIRENADFASGFLGGWSNNPSLFWLIELVSPTRAAAKYIVLGLLAGVALLPLRLEQSVLTTTLAILLLSANVHPWYLTWLLPHWAVLAAPPLAVWMALTPLQYWGLTEWRTSGRWVERGPWNAVVYGIAAGVFFVWWVRRRRVQ